MDKALNPKQLRSLHKLFDDVARTLMEHGVDLKMLLEKFREEDIPPSGDNIKDIFKSQLFRTHGKVSTKEMTNSDLEELLMYFNKNIGELTGESIAFPSRETLELIKHYSSVLTNNK